MGHPWSLFGLFLSLLQQMYVKKSMQCSAWCCDSNQRPPGHESPPVTTRPGLPPFSFISSGKLLCDIWLARSCDLRQNNDDEADNYPVAVWQVKSRQMSLKMPKNDFTRKSKDFETFTKLPKMWTIWANTLLPQALKMCSKCNKSSNLVTLIQSKTIRTLQDKS